MAYEGPEHHRRLAAVITERSKGIGKLLDGVCPSDGVALGKDGRCPVCRRRSKRVQAASEPESTPLDTRPEPSPAALKAAAERLFWERYEREKAEREQAAPALAGCKVHGAPPGQRCWNCLATPKPSRADVVREKFMTADGHLREM